MRTQIGFGLVMLLSAACTQSTFVGTQDDAGGDGGVNPVNGGGSDAGDAGSDATSEAVAPPGCDATKLPSDAPCVIDEYYGVFASSSLGTAVGDGTKAKPFGSLDAAITAAKKANKRVYACAETYAEQIHLESGVSVFGSFDCNGAWTAGKSHAKVVAPASPAATASNITTATRIDSVDLVAPDFTDKSQSSIALIANASPALTIVNATIHAGTGGKGDDGGDAIQLTDSASTKNGQSGWVDGVCGGLICAASNFAQASAGTNTCSGEAGHDGGPGGAGGSPGRFTSVQFGINNWIWDATNPVTAGNPTTPSAQTAQGGVISVGGSAGAAGTDGANGTSGNAFGLLTASSYAASDGSSGSAGAPGQGGGGSGGYNNLTQDYPANNYQGKMAWAEAGAGGGAGGCPGLAGNAGKGGGASIAIVALASGFTVQAVTIESSAGGAGGSAGVPSAPTTGGAGGTAPHTTGGGAGGSGGHAGVSGNGGGGPSIGIAYQGTKPALSAALFIPGQGGSGVAQRVVNGQTISASADGANSDTYAF